MLSIEKGKNKNKISFNLNIILPKYFLNMLAIIICWEIVQWFSRDKIKGYLKKYDKKLSQQNTTIKKMISEKITFLLQRL